MARPAQAPPEGLRITQLRHEGDYWRANVSVNGTTVPVDRQFGTWQAERRKSPRSRTFVRCEVRPAIARVLQQKVKRIERREQRQNGGS